ncbi:DUF3631 domain-containing protein [Gemmatimonadota bacterium]
MSPNDKDVGTQSDTTFNLKDTEPWETEVKGDKLLEELSGWLAKYAFLPPGAADAIAAWAVATWLVEEVHFAPILALLSPTKRTGKTTVLDLLSRLVRGPVFTSGFGITTAALFRLNHQYRPTIIIDEAERLRNQKTGHDIIGLLNAGHRRGGTIQRCTKGTDKGKWEVEVFDAFGFRAVGAIGGIWDTLSDRSIIIPMQRKPKDHSVSRFHGKDADEEGAVLRSKIVRWIDDNRAKVPDLLREVPRQDSLNDRENDNWAALFAVAQMAGGNWPNRLRDSADRLSTPPGDDGDPGELLIRDMREVFEREEWPEAIRSGVLAKELSAIESSPWGEYRGGRGISPHRLGKMLRPFGVSSIQARIAGGEKIRGYWLKDLAPVFERYAPTVEMGQLGQPNADGASTCPTPEPESGSEEEWGRTTAPSLSQLDPENWGSEKAREPRDVPLDPVPCGSEGEWG